MRIVATFDPTTETSETFNAGFSNGMGRIVVFNESNNNLQLGWDAFSTYCPCWTAMLYCITSNNVNISWAIQSTLATDTTPPISQVIVVAYDNNEPITGTYPAALVRQTNIGNAVKANVTSTNSILNTGSPPGTAIITVQPNDAASNTWTADNSGNLTIKSDNAGTLTTLLQLIAGASPAVKLAAAAVLVEALGNLKIDGTLESVGAATLDSTLAVTGAATLSSTLAVTGQITASAGVLIPNNATPVRFQAQTTTCQIEGDNAADQIIIDAPTGTRILQISSTGVQIQGSRNLDIGGSGTLKLRNSAGTLTRLGDAAGTGTGTVSHDLGVSPDFVAITTHAVGSQTVGYDSETSTQVHVTAAAGLAWFAFLTKR